MPSKNYILSFDVGTTSIKAGIIDTDDFHVISKVSDISVIKYPKSSWAEQDPDKLWSQIVGLSSELLKDGKIRSEDIFGMVFTGHMAGVLPVDKYGNPLRNIIIWLDERAAGLPKEVWQGLIHIQGYNIFKLWKFLRYTGGAPSKTGKDPISKIIWIRENEPDIYRKTSKFLDVKGFLIYKSTGALVTSHDEAHLTWLADAKRNKASWSATLLKDYKLSEKSFPQIKDSISIAGRVSEKASEELGVKNGTPVMVGAGDITTAAIGSGAIKDREPHIYIGTSDWIAAHISKMKTDIFHYIGSLLSAIPRRYLLIAEQEVAAGALEWAMKLLNFSEKDYKSVEITVDKASPGSNNLLFLPWFYGERAPIDDSSVRGGLVNLTFIHDKEDILHAIMEGVALNIRWAYTYFQNIVGYKEYVNIVGGGALFDIWCQIITDTLKIKVRRVMDPGDTGLRGGATIASVGLGIYKSFDEAVSRYKIDKIFTPNTETSKIYDKLFIEFKKFYKNNKKLYKKLNMH